ncbi:MAG: hypothetical protein LBL13_02005, partial [Bacteroidales bacterium]|jgi:RHS repeat-associated protein|nr:hypothetical protein [Bacteroidales bacterium]
VYDKADRLIASQDGVQRAKSQCVVNKYDALGRLLYTGTMSNTDSCQALRNSIHDLVITESYVGSGGFASTGYSCTHFSNQITPLLVNYYDEYSFLNLLSTTVKNNLTSQVNNDYGMPFSSAKGLQTGSRVYMLDGSGDYLMTSIYYDFKGQVVQTHKTNHWGGYIHEYSDYTFTGNLQKTLKQQNVTTITSFSFAELYEYTYDHADRPQSISYKINNKPAVILAAYEYDELGRLKKKLRHNEEDTEEFAHNIRNQITQIKSGDFEENLYYHENLPAGATSCYNGNIAATTWTYNNQLRGYRYSYDALNRLTLALTTHTSMGDRYSEYLSYNKQGNIMNLLRFGSEGNSFDLLTMNYNGNQLTNVWDDYGNQNQYSVKEYHSMHPTDHWQGETEFTYDANGNMISDDDRNISTIRYNLLNLPDTIQFGNGNQIINLYAADGRKLVTRYFTLVTPVVVPIGQTRQWTFTTDVIDETGIIYVDNCEYQLHRDPDTSTNVDWMDMLRLHNLEGYSERSLSSYGPWYSYYRRDHLGNNREVWRAPYMLGNNAKPASTAQRTQYYASGLPWNEGLSATQQPYKFNGKEFVEMHGYDTYDYGMRRMYPAIMRFETMDPLAEKYYSVSPYAYCLNNPVNAVDIGGQKVIFVNGYLGFGSPNGGSTYWNNAFVQGSQKYFHDNTTPYFTDAKHDILSTASGRHSKGYNYAKENYKSLIDGMNEGETFKFVSHSMGGAFSTGVQQYLEEQGWVVESSVFINTYQSKDVKTQENNSPFIIDYQTTNDPVLRLLGRNSAGGIKNSNLKIREKSKKEILYRHRDPIDSGSTFWNNLGSMMDYQNRYVGQDVMNQINTWLQQNPDIIVTYH